MTWTAPFGTRRAGRHYAAGWSHGLARALRVGCSGEAQSADLQSVFVHVVPVRLMHVKHNRCDVASSRSPLALMQNKLHGDLSAKLRTAVCARLLPRFLEECIMRIDEIYSRQAVHIPTSCTLQEAAVQMRDKHVGSLIVTEPAPAGERVVGILTDRDIVLQGTAAGADPGMTAVADVMTPGLVTVPLQANVHDAMQLMLSHGVRRLGVLDGEAVTGVLSMDDILGAMSTDWGMLSALVRNEQERERSGHVQSPLRM